MKRQLLRSLRSIAHALDHELVPRAHARYRDPSYDPAVALPPGASEWLRPDHPRLQELRRRYEQLSAPAAAPGQWSREFLRGNLDLRYFRGDNAYVWQYRAAGSDVELRYYLALQYLRSQPLAGLLDRLGEDGLFGAWTFDFSGQPVVSRDLLDSVNELSFLDRQLGLFERKGLRVLDIGAGYGRLAHRMTQALPGIARYVCVDGVPESTFLCDYYLKFRGCGDKALSLPLDEVEQGLAPDSFDLALNIHSFSECTLAAVQWWLAQLSRLRVLYLMIVPNNGERLLSTEADGSQLDFRAAVEDAGYRLRLCEPKYLDPTVQQFAQKHPDYYFLFERTG